MKKIAISLICLGILTSGCFNKEYNVAYEYRGWRGNFSAKYLGGNFLK